MLEKKKEEMDDEVQKLHVKLKQEQQRWDRECVAREKQQVNTKAMPGLSSRLPFWLYHQKKKNFFVILPSLTELVFCFLKAITVSYVFPERA